MAISGVTDYNSLYGSIYGTGSGSDSSLDYQSWVDKATSDAQALEDSLKAGETTETQATTESTATEAVESTAATDSAASTGSTSSDIRSATSTGTSSFLLGYKRTLQDLEAVSEQLRLGSRDNVFSKYESALEKLSNATTDDEKAAAQKAVDGAKQDIISAVKEFADQYNDTVSFLSSNAGRSDAVENQLKSMQRALSTEGALATVGLSVSSTGSLQVDEDALGKALDNSFNHVKDTLGGQFGIAERAATRATNILDNASIESIAGATDSSSISDFTLFASFAKGGSYNLSNYYAVGALLNTLV